jgi:phosphoribosylanthranilate isomerase
MIKICGLHRSEDLKLAKSLGADVLGMICGVPESPRNNSIKELTELFSYTEEAKTALLFRNADLQLIKDAIQEFKPSIVHLCGAESSTFRDQIKQFSSKTKVWQSYGIDINSGYLTMDHEQVLALLQESQVDQIVLDAKKSGKTGGTGCLLPLDILKSDLNVELSELMIAGGLNHENITTVLQKIKPKGVDVSSGIESSPGCKDPHKLKTFIHQAKSYLKN